MCLVQKFCGFLRCFFKSTLKRRSPHGSSDILRKNKKARQRRAFCAGIECWGFRPKPGPKDFLKKVLWNLKNFRQNKVVCLVRSSLAYLSPKERQEKQNGENRRSEKYILRSYDIWVWLGCHGRDVVFLILFV